MTEPRGQRATPPTPTRRDRRRSDGERGAVLVELALAAPVLFLLIFAIVDFGWAFGQHLDVRHGAREGARLAVVNYDAGGADQTADIVAETCSRMEADSTVTVELTLPGTAARGETVEVTVARPVETLTGFVDFALAGRTLRSTVVSRLERDATWTPTSGPVSCP